MLFLLDLPLCVLEEIVVCVINPLQHAGTEAKLENFADACHALRALLLTHPLFHKVVTKDIWRKALELNWPRVQTTCNVGPDSPGLVCRPAVEGGCLLATPSPRGPS